MTISPPYCGTPRLSHQCPVVVVVLAVVVCGTVVVVLVVDVVFVVAVVDVGLDVVVDADVFVDVAQDASNIAATNKKLKPNQINFLFNFLLLFN